MFYFYFFCICFQARHLPQRVSQRTVCNIYDNAHQLTSIKRTLRPYLFSTFSWSKGETRMIWILLIFLKKNLGRVTKNSILRNHCRISDITIKLKVSFCINLQYLLDWLYISLHYLVAGFFPLFLTECYDKFDHCKELKEAGDCSSSDPKKVYEVKTNCLVTCEFCGKGSWEKMFLVW